MKTQNSEQISTENLNLDKYLMLRRSRYLLPWSSPENLPMDLRIGSPIILKEINLVIPLASLGEQSMTFLETFLDYAYHDRHRDRLGLMVVNPDEVEAELQLYIGFFLDEMIENNTDSDALDLAVNSSLHLSIVDIESFLCYWDTIEHQLDGFYPIDEDFKHLPDSLQTCLDELPSLRLVPEHPIIQSLWESRLEKAQGLENLGITYLSGHFQQSPGGLNGQSVKKNDLENAIVFCQKALAYNPFNLALWANLATASLELQDYNRAKTYIQTVIRMDDSQSIYFNILGSICEGLGQFSQAANAYQKAIDINPNAVDSYGHLGDLLGRFGQILEAEEVYQLGIDRNPFHFGLYLNLGNLMLQNDRTSEAIETYRKALRYAPQNPDIFANLAVAFEPDSAQFFYYHGKSLELKSDFESAIVAYQKSLKIDRFHLDSLGDLAHCYAQCQETDRLDHLIIDSLHWFADQPIEQRPLRLLRHLLNYWNYRGDYQRSRDLVQTSRILQTREFLDLFTQLNLPILYNSESHLERIREDLESSLNSIEILLRQPEPLALVYREGFALIQSLVTFFINYQGKNDRPIAQSIAAMIDFFLSRQYPEGLVSSPQSSNITHSKRRIGYISLHFKNHNGANWSLGWLKNHDRDQLEIYTYYLGDEFDSITQMFCTEADFFRQLSLSDYSGFEEWLKQTVDVIQNDRLEALIFTDVGMEIRTVILSKLRLAPVQCVSWAHPVTTGSPTMDYFLSSSLMEPDSCPLHYSEKVVHLPHLSWFYTPPSLPEVLKHRQDFNLPNDRILYFSCQSLFKYLPQYDYIYAAIAQRVPDAYFVFLETYGVKSIFAHRLAQHFTQNGLSFDQYCQILPRQSSQDFLQLQGLADIYLDTLGWSGGNTTLQAISWHLPVVTYPKDLMRSRHSAAILQIIGVTETIASSEEEYIQIAVELGLNPHWRRSISSKLKNQYDRIFEDVDCVRALERFLNYSIHLSQLN